MNLKNESLLKYIIIFVFIFAFCCFPIWYFEYYVNQDGSPHLYNAFLLLEILKGNELFSSIYSINPYAIPNLSGHWIMTLLLTIFSPQIVSKIMITMTFGGFIAACCWLRWQVVGREGLSTAFFLGNVFAFNWLWFLGFYNFLLGVIGFTLTLGFYWMWRENLNLKRSLILTFLIVFVYFSHLISFGMLFGSICVIFVFSVKNRRKTNLLWTIAAFLPSLPFIISYKLLTKTGGEIIPTWHYLKNPLSLSNWLTHLQAADPFLLFSRKAFPFASTESVFFAVFSAMIWIVFSVLLLMAGTLIYRNKSNFNISEKIPWLIIFCLSVLFWLFSPDDFGKSHGGFMRERVLLCGLICFIPIFDINNVRWIKSLTHFCLIIVILFQSAVIWEYSVNTDKIAHEYLSAKPFIKDDDTLGSIVYIENSCRYKSSPLSNLNPLLGIGKNTRIWDNYELGYYLFPVIVNKRHEQEFIFNFRESNAMDICNPNENITEKTDNLKTLFEAHHHKFTVLLVWNGDEHINSLIFSWFEVEPFFHNGKVKLYRHK